MVNVEKWFGNFVELLLMGGIYGDDVENDEVS